MHYQVIFLSLLWYIPSHLFIAKFFSFFSKILFFGQLSYLFLTKIYKRKLRL